MDDITLRERRGEVLRLGRVHEDVDVPAESARVVEHARRDRAERDERLAQRGGVDVEVRGAARKGAEGGGKTHAHAGHPPGREARG